MRKLFLVASLVAMLPSANWTMAQDYPSRPITLIVPLSAGGSIDSSARILAERMKASLGQAVIVENVTGAGGSIGVGRVVRAAPDGYTISVGNWATHVGAPAIFPVQFDVLRDLEPVARLANSYVMLAAKKDLPPNSLKDLISWLDANPNRASFATVGAGSAAHLCGIYFQNNTGSRFQFVPYRGGILAIQDVVAGHIDLACGEASNLLPHVRSGKIKAYAVMAGTRWFAASDIPTVDEAGLSGLYLSLWTGMWVPKGTPSDVIAKLSAAVRESLADPAIRRRFDDLGQEMAAPTQQTPESLAAYHKSEIEKWWPIIKAANIYAE